MAVWLKFLADVDYRHASRAVTAYKAGMTIYTPDHIAQSDQLKGKVEEVEKPGAKDAIDANEGDGRRVYLTDGAVTADANDSSAVKPMGGRASGGPVKIGKPYLIGEHGPDESLMHRDYLDRFTNSLQRLND